MEPHSNVDILAIVEVWTPCGCDSQSYQPTTLFRSRKGNEMNRKELVIVDSSNTVRLPIALTHLSPFASPCSETTR